MRCESRFWTATLPRSPKRIRPIVTASRSCRFRDFFSWPYVRFRFRRHPGPPTYPRAVAGAGLKPAPAAAESRRAFGAHFRGNRAGIAIFFDVVDLVTALESIEIAGQNGVAVEIEESPF